MRGPASLSTRIAVAAVGVIAAWVALLTVGFNLALGVELQEQADAVVRSRAEAVATTVEVSAGRVSVRSAPGHDALDVGTWVFAGSELVEAHPGAPELQERARDLAGRGERLVTTGLPDRSRWYALPVLEGGQQVATVVTRLSLVPHLHAGRLVAVGSAGSAVLLLLGVYPVLRASVGRALAPVAVMTEQAARWSTVDVDRRFGDAPRPAELDALARTLDGLLDRLRAVLRHEERFSAELSHEVRTPLAAIVAETSLLRSRPRTEQESDAALAQIAAGADRISRTVETLVAASRTGGGLAPGTCDAGAVVADLALHWAVDHPGVALVSDVATGTAVGVGADVLERILGPVLDNAARYARSRVAMTASAGSGLVELHVDDDGPGVPADHVARVFDPGWRGDRADGHGGAGLGLGLVRRLVAAAGGTVSVVSSREGGRFVVALPNG